MFFKQFSLSEQRDLDRLLQAYLPWTKIHNFTAHREEERFALLNILDSALPHLLGLAKINPGDEVLDIGTGGGFPGMPLAVLQPEAEFTLLDSVGKKLGIIKEVCKDMEINNVKTVHARIEETAHGKSHREHYDVVVTKALAKWHTLLEYALPFVKVGGIFYAYQSISIVDELEDSQGVMEKLGGSLQNVGRYSLPKDLGERVIVEILKEKPTPEEFPREVGVPKKRPL